MFENVGLILPFKVIFTVNGLPQGIIRIGRHESASSSHFFSSLLVTSGEVKNVQNSPWRMGRDRSLHFVFLSRTPFWICVNSLLKRFGSDCSES